MLEINTLNDKNINKNGKAIFSTAVTSLSWYLKWIALFYLIVLKQFYNRFQNDKKNTVYIS